MNIPDRTFVEIKRDPDEPQHTCNLTSAVPTLGDIIVCPGCRWQVKQAAAYYEAHPEARPDWLVLLTAVIEAGP